jgi:hypothetical protein
MAQTYFVECYWPGVDEARLDAAVTRLTSAEDGDASVRWVDSTLIPADGIVLCVFEGPSAMAVRATADGAGLPSERIIECVRFSIGGRSKRRSDDA